MPIPTDTESIVRLPARDIIVERLRRWIVDGVLQPGEIVRDGEIAASLGLSRTPVREALLQLEREKLIETTPQRWTRVAPLDTSQGALLYPPLIELEVLAVRLAAEHSDLDLEPIEAAQRSFAAIVESAADVRDPESVAAMREADDRFHGAIVRAARNPYVADALFPLKVLARRFENHYFGTTSNIVRASVADHDQILAALRRRDPVAATQITRRNWERSLHVLGKPRDERE